MILTNEQAEMLKQQTVKFLERFAKAWDIGVVVRAGNVVEIQEEDGAE